MTTISVELTQQEELHLRQRAKELQVTPEVLAAALLKSGLHADDAEFSRVAAQVVEKNRELYRRLG